MELFVTILSYIVLIVLLGGAILFGLSKFLRFVCDAFELKEAEPVIQSTPSQYWKLHSKYSDIIEFAKPYYMNNRRSYHDWGHIHQGLAIIADHELEIFADMTITNKQQARTQLVLAWLFHDIIYDPTQPDCEAKSAILASDTLAFSFPQYNSAGVERCILATKTHSATDDITCNIICDLDLIRLGSEYDMFIQYTYDVLREYRESYPAMSRHKFLQGRVKFLRELQHSNKPLFKTPFFNGAYVRKAQTNINRFCDENTTID